MQKLIDTWDASLYITNI